MVAPRDAEFLLTDEHLTDYIIMDTWFQTTFKGEWIHSKSTLKSSLKPFKQNQTQSQIINEQENLDSGF